MHRFAQGPIMLQRRPCIQRLPTGSNITDIRISFACVSHHIYLKLEPRELDSSFLRKGFEISRKRVGNRIGAQ